MQREILIEVLLQNEHITLRDASNLVNLNYESAKSIWTIYRKQGRRHKLQSGICKHRKNAAFDSDDDEDALASFDRKS